MRASARRSSAFVGQRPDFQRHASLLRSRQGGRQPTAGSITHGAVLYGPGAGMETGAAGVVGSVLASVGAGLKLAGASLAVVAPDGESYAAACTANAVDVASADDVGAGTVIEPTVDVTGRSMDVAVVGPDTDVPTVDTGVVVPASAGTS